jgi:hypothetical protein
MRELDELIARDHPAMPVIETWIESGTTPCEVLPPAASREQLLLQLQVTTRSPLGALAYDTGGLLIDGGWVRVLGSGHPRLARDLGGWNEERAQGLFLVADDAVGGFFALDGGALGPGEHDLWYWPPDHLGWQRLKLSFGEFLHASLHGMLAYFYEPLRWPGWQEEAAALPGDRCFAFDPPLWTEDGSLERSERRIVPIDEAYDSKLALVRRPRTPPGQDGGDQAPSRDPE